MELIAHTPPNQLDEGFKLHTYHDHIQDMLEYGLPLFENMLSYCNFDDEYKSILLQTFKATLMLHDLGKVDEENQQILRLEKAGKLPIDHIDAGIAIANEMDNQLLAWLIRGHHAPGLANLADENFFKKQIRRNVPSLEESNYFLRGKRYHRNGDDRDYCYHEKTILTTNSRLAEYKQKQINTCGSYPNISCKLPDNGITTRLMLSALVEADHTSASHYHQNIVMKQFTKVNQQWQARLNKLADYVNSLDTTPYAQKSQRNQLRELFFNACLTQPLNTSSLEKCSASVGMGKTTAVTAYLLRKAIEIDASRLIIVAPFTNILSQTTRTFRKSLVLDGENALTTVIEHHHKVEFSDKNMRQYASNWEAPIIITTAVQFFETLGSAEPTRLRKLHHLVGSVIFIDESHACLPPELLAVAWKWLRELATHWCCQIVFSSGSMVEFWQDPFLIDENDIQNISEILSSELIEKIANLEYHRVNFQRITPTVDKHQLCEKIINDLMDYQGDRPCSLVILNTTQSSAFIAYYLAQKLNQNNLSPLHDRQILQLSTAIAPIDRIRIIEEIERRQDSDNSCEWHDKPWFLVATSCVEAGVDLDFQFGYRESCSVTSFLQTSGRVNRHGTRQDSVLYDFKIIADEEINEHPSFRISSEKLHEYWLDLLDEEKPINQVVTKALRNTFIRSKSISTEKPMYDRCKKTPTETKDALIEAETKRNFQTVSNEFKIIKGETFTVITSGRIVETLRLGYFVDWKEIQNHSVQLWAKKIDKFKLQPIPNTQADHIYSWVDTYDYDDFLGIFAGVIEVDKFFEMTGGVW